MSDEEIVPGTIEFWAHDRPESIAIHEDNRSMTYREWNDQADHLAEGLARAGLTAGDIVAVRTQIRLEWVIINSALAKLGCSLLGTNWRLTPAELLFVLSNSGTSTLICDDLDPSPLQATTEELGLKTCVSMDTKADGFLSLEDLMVEDAPARFSRGEAPLVIYTSGTTGLPKGVLSRTREKAVTDPKVAEYLLDVAESRASKPGDISLITLPMHHAAGPAAVAGALRLGNQIVLLRRFDPERALQLIERHRVTDWTGVPTMFKRIAGLPESTLTRHDVSSVRKLGVGAAPVTPELKEWIDSYFGEDKLSEGYGSTETGMITFLPPGEHRDKPGSSGKPHKHVDLSIRDEQGVPVPTGTVGEIWVRTPAVIDRYLNADPLGEDTLDADGYFRIGDMGHVDEDGYLFITDRAKDMIISGGVNIYPAEIEAALTAHDAVQDAAVVGIPNTEFGEEVKAFVELKPGRSATPEDLMRYAAERLASYKRPRSIDLMDELPRNTMGKLLKRELRDPYWQDKERKV